MVSEEKSPRTMKLIRSKVRIQLNRKYCIYILMIVLIVIFAIILAHNTFKPNPSKSLASKVNTLQSGNHTCSDGLKQVGFLGAQLAHSNQYTQAVKEKALNYLMTCEFMTRNKTKALVYAQELRMLYQQDGAQGLQNLKNLNIYMNFMQNYGK